MSTSIDTAFIKSYEAMVHLLYQQKGSKMRNTVRVSTSVNGKDHTFQKLGKGVASTKSRHGDVPVMNAEHSVALATLADYYAGDFVDDLDVLKTNINEMQATAMTGAYALGRKTDEQILTALSGASAGQTIGDGSAEISKSYILQALALLNKNSVPNDGDRYCAVTPNAWSKLLDIAQFSSSDYVSDTPWGQGVDARRWLNTWFYMHENLPTPATGKRYCFWYHKSAVGHAIGSDVKAEITRDGRKAAWFVNNMMSQGSVLIDETGVVRIHVADTLTVT